MMIEIDTLLAWGAAYKKLTAEEIIFSEGSQSNFYYQLVSGRVRWVNINDEGRDFLQIIILPGECFGELPLFDNEPFAATAIADTDAVILRLNKSSFQQLIHENPEIHFSFSKLLAQRVRFKCMILKEMANHNPEQNITALFSYFKSTQTNICLKCNRINLTRQQIADMTGMRVETVIRAIRSLHEKGKLHIEKGKVYMNYDLNHSNEITDTFTLQN
ncbi:MAG: Crp/Fnr family transcriptional regulator [Ferruginibacter sp.]